MMLDKKENSVIKKKLVKLEEFVADTRQEIAEIEDDLTPLSEFLYKIVREYVELERLFEFQKHASLYFDELDNLYRTLKFVEEDLRNSNINFPALGAFITKIEQKLGYEGVQESKVQSESKLLYRHESVVDEQGSQSQPVPKYENYKDQSFLVSDSGNLSKNLIKRLTFFELGDITSEAAKKKVQDIIKDINSELDKIPKAAWGRIKQELDKLVETIQRAGDKANLYIRTENIKYISTVGYKKNQTEISRNQLIASKAEELIKDFIPLLRKFNDELKPKQNIELNRSESASCIIT
ncbi:MAG TPA: hypothetical protein VHE99_04095 [Gammaproteobacteria bacterium]|nr:hypothetical protein [Gammaproteobacteria bacterium]